MLALHPDRGRGLTRGWVVQRFRGLRFATMRSFHLACEHRVVRPTLVIVDDHAEFRRSAGALLAAEGFDVVGEASDGPEAIDAVARLQPEVVLLDIQLPGIDGLTVAEQLATGVHPPAVVLTSSREAAAYGLRLHRAAARGFIVKSELSGEAVAALLG